MDAGGQAAVAGAINIRLLKGGGRGGKGGITLCRKCLYYDSTMVIKGGGRVMHTCPHKAKAEPKGRYAKDTLGMAVQLYNKKKLKNPRQLENACAAKL